MAYAGEIKKLYDKNGVASKISIVVSAKRKRRGAMGDEGGKKDKERVRNRTPKNRNKRQETRRISSPKESLDRSRCVVSCVASLHSHDANASLAGSAGR
jgi:hypothetical protein